MGVVLSQTPSFPLSSLTGSSTEKGREGSSELLVCVCACVCVVTGTCVRTEKDDGGVENECSFLDCVRIVMAAFIITPSYTCLQPLFIYSTSGLEVSIPAYWEIICGL